MGARIDLSINNLLNLNLFGAVMGRQAGIYYTHPLQHQKTILPTKPLKTEVICKPMHLAEQQIGEFDQSGYSDNQASLLPHF
jgi:hypothetical protein